MIEPSLSPLFLALLQAEYGPFTALITFLQGILVAGGSIGVLIGLALIAVAGPRSDRHELGIKVLEGSGVGLLIGLTAEPIYNAILRVVVGV